MTHVSLPALACRMVQSGAACKPRGCACIIPLRLDRELAMLTPWGWLWCRQENLQEGEAEPHL